MTQAYKPPVTFDWRKMNIQPDTKKLGVETDRNSEVVVFQVPRIYEGFDMADRRWFVDTLNQQGEIFDTAAPTIAPVSPGDETLQMYWTVGPLPASADGKVKVRLRALAEDFVWHSETGEFTVADTFVTGDPPEPPGMSYFNEISLRVAGDAKIAEAARQAVEGVNGLTVSAASLPAGSTPTAKISDVGGYKVIAFGIPGGAKGDKGDTGAVGPPSNIDAVASRWPFHAGGASVKIHPAFGSKMQVTASATTTVTINGAGKSFTANVAQEIEAIAGANLLTAASGTLKVAYNRDSMDVLNALTAPLTATGPIATLDHPVEGLPLEVTARLVAAQEGSGDPSPENVRRIAGHSNLNLYRFGKNRLQSRTPGSYTSGGITYTVNADGSVILNGTSTGFNNLEFMGGSSSNTTPLFVLPPGTYTLKGTGSADFQVSLGVVGDQAWKRTYAADLTFTITEWTNIVRVFIQMRSSGTAYTFSNYVFWLQLELGSVSTAYEPYTGDTYPVTLPEELGGLPGTEDEVRSDGTVIKRTKRIFITGGENWQYSATAIVQPTDTSLAMFYISLGDIALAANGASSIFPWVRSAGGTVSIEAFGAHSTTRHLRLVLKKSRLIEWDDAWTSAQKMGAAKSWLAAQYAAGTPVVVEYELTTPQTLTFNPVIIPALSGVNHIMSDGGGNTTAAGRGGAEYFDARLAKVEQYIAGL